MTRNANGRWLLVILNLCFLLQVADAMTGELRFFEARSDIKVLKNAALVLLTAVCAMAVWKNRGGSGNRGKLDSEFRSVRKLVAILALCSLYLGMKNGGNLLITSAALLKFILPVLAAYLVARSLEEREILSSLRVFLYAGFLVYLFCKVFPVLSVNRQALFSIDWLHSQSPFESDMFSPMAISFLLYFCYNRKSRADLAVAVLFNLLAFKRLAVLFTPVLLAAGMPRFADLRVKGRWIWVLRAAVLGLVAFYYSLCMGAFQDLLTGLAGQSVDGFTMGRSWRMRLLREAGYSLRGLGTLGISSIRNNVFSTGGYSITGMEMDMIQILMECSWVGLAAVVWLLSNLARRSFYGFCAVVFLFGQMITSHWYDITYFWLVFYFLLASQRPRKGGSVREAYEAYGRRVRFVWGQKRAAYLRRGSGI
ncbi:MAG: hypothetical protein LBQ15_08290 [Clostridium sp.]|jgi:hypothetical protein|nr:hypothetical protein [Clostridium sp.]